MQKLSTENEFKSVTENDANPSKHENSCKENN